jgi:hypothetical protein
LVVMVWIEFRYGFSGLVQLRYAMQGGRALVSARMERSRNKGQFGLEIGREMIVSSVWDQCRRRYLSGWFTMLAKRSPS